jgi:cytochrome c553
VAPEPFALGLLPVPENLALVGRERSLAEIYWTVRNGLKMTGMPAWQYRLDDGAMWDVAAFVKQLPQLSPAGYAALKPAAPKDDATPAGAPDAKRGKKALEQYACVTCHEIPAWSAPIRPSARRSSTSRAARSSPASCPTLARTWRAGSPRHRK